MKNFYRIAGKMESSPLHLGISLLFATAVMLFINGTIGAMGGIPLWVGMMVVFYVIRGIVIAGNRMPHHLANVSRDEVRYMFFSYGVGFFLLWAVMKILLMLAQMLGWGNINGMNASEYFDSIYGSTLVERWAYVFAAILMVSFVLSLFPLIVIRRRKLWIAYLLADGVVFWGLCWCVTRICKIWIPREDSRKIQSVMDALLLCVTPHKWQAGLFLFCAVFLMLVIMGISYKIARRHYGPRPGNMEQLPDYFQEDSEQVQKQKKRSRRKMLVVLCVAVGVIGVGTVGVLVTIISNNMEAENTYYKVAECLTEDHSFGPIVYDNEVYIPIQAELNLHETQKPLGYLAYKGENVESRIYKLTMGNLLYQGAGNMGASYLEMYGADMNSYKRMDKVEEENRWTSDSVFVLWDEEWLDETAYSKERTGYSICEKGFVQTLENEFGVVAYHPEDFADYDAYFTISGYTDPKKAFGDEVNCGHWVGCILVKNNEFYYGNYENKITGVTLQELLDVLGGNDSSSNEMKEQLEQQMLQSTEAE